MNIKKLGSASLVWAAILPNDLQDWLSIIDISGVQARDNCAAESCIVKVKCVALMCWSPY